MSTHRSRAARTRKVSVWLLAQSLGGYAERWRYTHARAGGRS